MAAFLRFEDSAAQRETMFCNVGFRRFDPSLLIGEEPIVGPLMLALFQLGNEVPVELRKERVEKMGAGIGFVALRQSDVILFPCGAGKIVKRVGYITRRRVR